MVNEGRKSKDCPRPIPTACAKNTYRLKGSVSVGQISHTQDLPDSTGPDALTRA